VKALLYMFGDIVMFIVAVIALYWSWESVHVSGNSARSPTGSGSARPWFLFAVPFGFALVIFRLTQSFLRDLADLRNGRPSTKATSCSTREGPRDDVATTRGPDVELGWDFYGPVILFVVLVALAVPVWAAIGAATITMLVVSGALPLSSWAKAFSTASTPSR
jgi:hypothetical protein